MPLGANPRSSEYDANALTGRPVKIQITLTWADSKTFLSTVAMVFGVSAKVVQFKPWQQGIDFLSMMNMNFSRMSYFCKIYTYSILWKLGRICKPIPGTKEGKKRIWKDFKGQCFSQNTLKIWTELICDIPSFESPTWLLLAACISFINFQPVSLKVAKSEKLSSAMVEQNLQEKTPSYSNKLHVDNHTYEHFVHHSILLSLSKIPNLAIITACWSLEGVGWNNEKTWVNLYMGG